MNRNSHTFRLLPALLGALLSLLLVFAINQGPQEPAQAAGTIPDAAVPETVPETIPETLSETTVPPETEPAEKINLLLIGRDGTALPARSDTMILCTFDPEQNRLTLTSILRDLWIDIPGHGQDRINAAYAYGGRELLDETIETAFGIPIHGNVEVDFDSFAAVTDLLGGVDLELRADEAREISRVTGTELEEGTRHLSGAQALAFARIRKLDPDGDFSRTERQRRLLAAMRSAGQALSPRQRLALARDVLPLVSTDFSLGELLSMGRRLLPIMDNGELFSQHIPQTYTDRTIRGMSVLEADREKMAALLQSTAGCR